MAKKSDIQQVSQVPSIWQLTEKGNGVCRHGSNPGIFVQPTVSPARGVSGRRGSGETPLALYIDTRCQVPGRGGDTTTRMAVIEM